MIIKWLEIRNWDVHCKEEVGKQKNRKAKAEISAWALHKLKDQVLPNNTFLFYQDVEEEEKKKQQLNCKDFVTMKTKAITKAYTRLLSFIQPHVGRLETVNKIDPAPELLDLVAGSWWLMQIWKSIIFSTER